MDKSHLISFDGLVIIGKEGGVFRLGNAKQFQLGAFDMCRTKFVKLLTGRIDSIEGNFI